MYFYTFQRESTPKKMESGVESGGQELLYTKHTQKIPSQINALSKERMTVEREKHGSYQII